MANYTKENPRITVKFIDNDRETVLFEIKDRNWMNVGELFTDHIANSLIEPEIKKKRLEPDEIMVIAIGIFKKT